MGLVACGAPVPSGQLLGVAEVDGAPVTMRYAPAGSMAAPLATWVGAAYPGPADPLQTHALLVAVTEGPRGHTERLWLVSLEDGDALALSQSARRIRNPAWSPDGSFVVFESDAESFRDLYRVARDGSATTRLTYDQHGSFEPVVSPDGQHIAFGTSRDGNAEIYVMDADGSRPVRITSSPYDDVRPRWAPDGETLTWLSHVDGMARVWRVDPHAAQMQPRPVLAATGRAVHLDHVWSPDGSQLAVVIQTSARDIDLWVVEPEDGERLAEIAGPGVDEHPAWSADGRWLAFSSTRAGNAAIYRAAADGTQLERVSPEGPTSWLPRWVTD
jgi:TolB protein